MSSLPKLIFNNVKNGCVIQQVRHLQLSTEEKPQEQIPKPVRRTSSRRSAYAFSHQQGYGELITSGKNMRTCSVSSVRSPQSPPHSSLKWMENILKEKNKVGCVSGENFMNNREVGREQDAKTVDT